MMVQQILAIIPATIPAIHLQCRAVDCTCRVRVQSLGDCCSTSSCSSGCSSGVVASSDRCDNKPEIKPEIKH
jgi:hypothetical protein